ncbi:MAG: amidase, partial [Acidimicrobiia bacterium]|nr:amidase [Acidimicrobiia bacterium]
ISCREAVAACLKRLAAVNSAVNAVTVVLAEEALAAADEADRRIKRGEALGPLHGVPVTIKENIDQAGAATTNGVVAFRDLIAETDSPPVANWKRAGAIIIGRTNTPAFSLRWHTDNELRGPTLNPWDRTRTPGGSSGGSAAAVAAGLVPFSTASDGGGSTRIPAAFTWLVGLKASYGRIPHERASPSETSCYGALTTTVRDAARHLDVAAGPHDLDRASLPAPGRSYERAIEALDVGGLRALWSPDMGYAVVVPEIEEVARAAADALVDAAGLRRVERPFSPSSPMRTWLSAGAADMWLDLEDGMWPECADELTGLVRGSLRRTQDWTMPRYARALRHRQLLEAEVADLFTEIDVLLTPTTATAAYAAEGPLPMEIDGKDARHSGPVPFTMLANLCWNPAISVPAGLTHEGLPVGLQITVRRHADEVALRLGRIFEQARPWPRLASERA